MNADKAMQIALSKPTPPQIFQQLDIVYELIEMAAQKGKFSIRLEGLARATRVFLQKKGYDVDVVDFDVVKISWYDHGAQITSALKKLTYGR